MQSFQRTVLRSALAATRIVSAKPQLIVPSRSVQAPLRNLAPISRLFSSTVLRALEGTLTGENAKPADADAAAEELEQKLEDAAEQVPTKRPSQRSSDESETPHSLFIRNMVFEATEEHLNEAYSKYGTVTKVALARDSRGLSRGYGFVWFTNADELENAIAGTDGSFWHGRRIQVSVRAPRAPRSDYATNVPKVPTRSLFIGNIPYETTDAELNKLFKGMDGVKDIRVAVDRTTGWPRGFAHVDFHDVETAANAYDSLQGTAIEGRQLRFDYATDYTQRDGSATEDSPRRERR